MAFQLTAFQNLSTRGVKGFQEGAATPDDYTQKHHHLYQGWLLPLLAILHGVFA